MVNLFLDAGVLSTALPHLEQLISDLCPSIPLLHPPQACEERGRRAHQHPADEYESRNPLAQTPAKLEGNPSSVSRRYRDDPL